MCVCVCMCVCMCILIPTAERCSFRFCVVLKHMCEFRLFTSCGKMQRIRATVPLIAQWNPGITRREQRYLSCRLSQFSAPRKLPFVSDVFLATPLVCVRAGEPTCRIAFCFCDCLWSQLRILQARVEWLKFLEGYLQHKQQQ